MAKNETSKSHGHHGKMSHSSDSPDRVVDYGDKLLQFSRTHVVTITLAVMLVVVGIFTVSKIANDNAIAAKERYRELNMLMFTDKAAVGSEEDAVEYISRFEVFCKENTDRDFAPRALWALAGNAYSYAREYLNADMAQISIWAYDELNKKFPNQPMVAAVHRTSNRNLVGLRLEEARDFIKKIPKMKEKCDDDGLYVPPESSDPKGPASGG